MAVVPDQADGVTADGFEPFEFQIGTDRARVENPSAGPFVLASGARAPGAKLKIGEPVGSIRPPGEFQDLIALTGADVGRGVAHGVFRGRAEASGA